MLLLSHQITVLLIVNYPLRWCRKYHIFNLHPICCETWSFFFFPWSCCASTILILELITVSVFFSASVRTFNVAGVALFLFMSLTNKAFQFFSCKPRLSAHKKISWRCSYSFQRWVFMFAKYRDVSLPAFFFFIP